jgi:hypothetical protein
MFISYSSGGWKVQDLGAGDLVSGEDCLLVCRQLSCHLSISGGERMLWYLFLTLPWDLTLMTSWKHNHPSKIQLPNPVTLGVRASTCAFGGHNHPVPSMDFEVF